MQNDKHNLFINLLFNLSAASRNDTRTHIGTFAQTQAPAKRNSEISLLLFWKMGGARYMANERPCRNDMVLLGSCGANACQTGSVFGVRCSHQRVSYGRNMIFFDGPFMCAHIGIVEQEKGVISQ